MSSISSQTTVNGGLFFNTDSVNGKYIRVNDECDSIETVSKPSNKRSLFSRVFACFVMKTPVIVERKPKIIDVDEDTAIVGDNFSA